MVHQLSLRRLFGKRRIFMACMTVVTMGVMYICYQALSIRQLGRELSDSAEHSKHKDFQSNYQKADLPLHMLPRADNAEEKNPNRDSDPLPRDTFKDHGIRIRGVLNEDVKRYIPNSRGNFRCIHGTDVEIAYHRVNDNYCDCLDGSDEPSTSACMAGRFFCEQQPITPVASVFVTSSRVNDGICDCCDGSDEWGHIMVPEHARISELDEKKIGIDQVPCTNRCLKGYVALERGL